MAWRNFKGFGTAGNKYNAHKTEVDGISFDSHKEAARYVQLSMLQKAGEIKDLKLQVKFVLIPTQREPDIIGKRGGRKPGRLIEQELSYVADFVYIDTATGQQVVEDVKGYTGDGSAYKIFVIKRKLMLYKYGIRVQEI